MKRREVVKRIQSVLQVHFGFGVESLDFQSLQRIHCLISVLRGVGERQRRRVGRVGRIGKRRREKKSCVELGSVRVVGGVGAERESGSTARTFPREAEDGKTEA